MKSNLVVVLATLIVALLVGILVGRWWSPATGSGSGAAGATGEREILYWVAPMDPNYRRDEPGKSPMGMDLIPVYADEMDADPSVVAIDPTMVSNLGVRTARALRGPLARRIETVGYVGYDEDTLQQVATRVDGWIEQLYVKSTGEAVERGQVLFEFYSPTLVNAQEEYLASLASRNTGLQEASRARLTALGVTGRYIDRLARTRQVRQRAPVYAERAGVVAHLGVREGAYVTPASQILSVADLTRVWVLAEVFERQASWVSRGLDARVKLDSMPDESWAGVVDYVYPELDPITRTLKVRLRFANPEQALRPNMLARVTIMSADSDPVVHVPRAAVIRGGATDRVVLALGKGRFRAQPVDLGQEFADRVAIQRGVSAGDQVVVSGQFLIDSESNIDAALARFEAGDAGMDHSEMDHSQMDHSQMDHGEMDHSQMDHSQMDHGEMDHSQMDHSQMDHGQMDHSQMDHSQMDHSQMDHSQMDHSQMDHGQMDHSQMDHGQMDHGQMDHSQMDHSQMNHSGTESRP
jgi:Cu(I)/Ag(I) efflux system membrane fusion protein